MKPKTMTRRHGLALGLAAGATGLLAGCGVLPKRQPPPQLYVLSPKSTFPEELKPVNWQLGVDLPASPASLRSTRIAVSRVPLTLDYYAGAQWVDDAPAMVQRLLIESFENSNRIVGVGRMSVSLRADYLLQVELREFQAEYRAGETAPPTINVRVNTKLVRMPQRVIIASSNFTREIDAPENKMAVIVKTFDQALGKVMRDIVVWTLTMPAKIPSTE